MNRLTIVTSLPVLKKLAKHGYIALHAHTGKTVYWNGSKLTAWYIDDKLKTLPPEFIVKYQDGCFYPFVYCTKLIPLLSYIPYA